jgi:peptidylprolyl isomerase
MRRCAAIAAEKKPVGPITSALCDETCLSSLPEKVTLPSGLAYQDIVVGSGTKPVVGYQIVVNYVAMTPEGRAFDSSIEKGAPYDIR